MTLAAVALIFLTDDRGLAQTTPAPAATPEIEAKIAALLPDLERYVNTGMAEFDVPGTAVGIVADDRLVYAKGFGRLRKGGNEPVDTRTVFQIGSTTKAFLATTLAIAVDRGKLHWNDRVIDLDADFALKDPYVTREFRVYDLLAQRSGLPPQTNTVLGLLGFDGDWLMHSLRFVEPITSFRSTFSYINITHLFAGRIVAKALGAADWPSLARREIVEPLGMRDTSFTLEAITGAPDHAVGHRWTATGSVEIPFDTFPYVFEAAGDINSTVEDLARWLRLQIDNGAFEGHRLVSAKNLAVTRTPKIAISETLSYATGWFIDDTANGRVVRHEGDTNGFGAEVSFLPKQRVGVVVLSNEDNKGFPLAIAGWVADTLLGNPESGSMQGALARAKAAAAKAQDLYKRPATPRPPPDLAALAGNYASAALGPADIRPDSGALVLTLQQTGARLRLEPFDGTVFTLHLLPEGRFAAAASAVGGPLGFAEFEADAVGKLTRLRWMRWNQSYVLQRRRD